MMQYYRGGMMGFGFGLISRLFGAFLCIAFLVLIILILVKAFRNRSSFSGYTTGHEYPRQTEGPKENARFAVRALEILNERYAKGEIDDDEYRRRKTELLK